ncbi:MAG: hypothetical protein V7603_6047 [Micromonosporaceae bacterium]
MTVAYSRSVAEIRLDVDYRHSVDRVWRALTDPRILDRWFLPGTLGTTIGAHYQLRPGETDGLAGPIDVEVLEAVEEQRLVMQWTGEKLHTEMTWALMTTPDGSRLSVVQTGFIGTPQSVRRTELRQAYTFLFMQALPPVLDQLASGTVDLGGERPLLHTAIPRLPRPERPATAPIGLLAQLLRGPGRWRMIATGAAVVGMLALAVVVLVVGLNGDGTRRQAQPLPPIDGGAGVASPPGPDVTSGGVTSGPGPTGQPGAVPAGSPPHATKPVVPGAPIPPTDSPIATADTRLAASYQTTKVSGAGAYTGRITISAYGSGTVSGWTVVVTLADASTVKTASGASYTQSGQTVTFTPNGDAEVSAGRPVSFTFRVNKKNGGIQQPLTCSIDGQRCGM